MIRTPPRRETLNKYSILTSPESPSAATSDGEPDGSPARDEEETPRPRGSNFGKLDTLSNEEILKHIQLLQLVLQKRGLSNNPRNLVTEFGFTPKRVRTTRSSIDPPQASRPAIAQHPSEDLNKIEYVNFQPAQTSQRHSRVENSTQSRRFPPLPARPQKSRTPPAPAQTHKDRPQHTAGCPTKTDRLAKSPNDKIPPIILRDKTQWAKTSTTIKQKGINFSKAQNITDGIRIFPASEADFRALSRHFSSDGIPFHTYYHLKSSSTSC